MVRGLVVVLFGALLLNPLPVAALTPPEIRLLQSQNPADWDKAVQLICPDERHAVPGLLVGAVTERLPQLSPQSQLRLIRRNMTYALERDPRVAAAFRQLAAEGTPEVRQAAQQALDELGRNVPPAPPSSTSSARPVWQVRLLRVVGAVTVLAPLALGVVLLLWGLRLLQLHRLLRLVPISRIRTLTPGLVALRGEVQPHGEPLIHPFTDEPCVYYVGAERTVPQLRFWLVDAGGRVLVDPAGLVMLSEDGLLQPGETVHLLAHAERSGAGDGAERWLLRKDRTPRSAFERLVHTTLERLFRLAAGRFNRMLFSDPQRCFWLWDDLTGNPFGGRRELATIVAVFACAGVWLAVAALVAAALLERDLGLLGAWLY